MVPVIFFLLGLFVFRWNGAYYLSGNLDPDYPYLVNSLAVSQGKIPGHWDHPGMTLQFIGARVIQLTTLGLTKDEQAYRVLKNPEFYAHMIGLLLLLLHSLALTISGFLVWRFTLCPWFTILFQSASLSFFSLWLASSKLSPDVLTWSLGLLLLSLLLPRLAGNKIFRHFGELDVWLAGVLSGLILATKITGLPLIFVPLWCFRKNLADFIRMSLGAFLTLAASIWLLQGEKFFEFGYFFLRWVGRLAIHRGRYGDGEVGFPGIVELVSALITTVSFLLPLGLAFLLILLFLPFLFRYRRKFENRELLLSYFFLIAISAVQFLIVAKHPGDRYLIPQVAILALLLPLSFTVIGKLAFKPKINHVAFLKFTALLFLFLGLGNGGRLLFQNQTRTQEILRAEAISVRVASIQCRVANFYRGSSQEFALAFGNNYARYAYTELLMRIYPSYLAYEPGRGFVDFARADVPSDRVFSQKPICLRGTPGLEGPRDFFEGFELRMIEEATSDDALFLFEPHVSR